MRDASVVFRGDVEKLVEHFENISVNKSHADVFFEKYDEQLASKVDWRNHSQPDNTLISNTCWWWAPVRFFFMVQERFKSFDNDLNTHLAMLYNAGASNKDDRQTLFDETLLIGNSLYKQTYTREDLDMTLGYFMDAFLVAISRRINAVFMVLRTPTPEDYFPSDMGKNLVMLDFGSWPAENRVKIPIQQENDSTLYFTQGETRRPFSDFVQTVQKTSESSGYNVLGGFILLQGVLDNHFIIFVKDKDSVTLTFHDTAWAKMKIQIENTDDETPQVSQHSGPLGVVSEALYMNSEDLDKWRIMKKGKKAFRLQRINTASSTSSRSGHVRQTPQHWMDVTMETQIETHDAYKYRYHRAETDDTKELNFDVFTGPAKGREPIKVKRSSLPSLDEGHQVNVEQIVLVYYRPPSSSQSVT